MTSFDNNVGPLIKNIRNSKGITQRALVKEGTPNRICTIRHLRKIEQGQIEPNPKVLNKLLHALGVSLPKFTSMMQGEKMVLFNNELEAVRNLFFEGEYEQAEEGFDKLRQSEFFDINNPTIMQSMLLYEGMILNYLKGQHSKCLEKLYEALQITSRKIIRHSRPNVDYIAQNILSLTEYRILLMTITTEEKLGNIASQIEVLTAINKSLCNKKVDSETKNKLLPAVYFNLSNALLEEDAYDKSLEVAEKGVAFCLEAKVYRVFGKLLWNKGCALFHLNHKCEAIDYFKKAYDSFGIHGDNEAAVYSQKIAAEKYGVWFR